VSDVGRKIIHVARKNLRVFGVILLAFLLIRLDWQRLARSVLQADISTLLLAFFGYGVLFTFMVWLKTQRVIALTPHPLKGMTATVMSYLSLSGLWGMVTPGRLGEISRLWYLERLGVEKSTSMAVWIWDRLLDLISTIILGSLALGFSLMGFQLNVFLIACYTFIFIIIAIVLFNLLPRVNWGSLSRRLGAFFDRYRNLQKYSAHLFQLGEAMSAPKNRLVPILCTLALQLTSSLSLYIVFTAFGCSLNLYSVAALYSASVLVSMLPVSVSGLGTREVTFIAFLGAYGISAEMSVLVSLLDGVLLPVFFLLVLSLCLARGETLSRSILNAR
jgi:uncharacterized protein (TIRG00374 family)